MSRIYAKYVGWRNRPQPLAKRAGPNIAKTVILRRPPGRRRIYCSIGSSPCDFHMSIPERRHVCLQRGTDAAKDPSTPLRMTCVTTNPNRWQPGFRYPGQTRTRSLIEATFRTLSLRIPQLLDSSDSYLKMRLTDGISSPRYPM